MKWSQPLIVAALAACTVTPSQAAESEVDCAAYGRNYWEGFCLCAIEAARADYDARVSTAAPRDVSYDDMDQIALDAGAGCAPEFAEGVAQASDGRSEERAREMGELQRGLIASRLWLLIEQWRTDDIAATR